MWREKRRMRLRPEEVPALSIWRTSRGERVAWRLEDKGNSKWPSWGWGVGRTTRDRMMDPVGFVPVDL